MPFHMSRFVNKPSGRYLPLRMSAMRSVLAGYTRGTSHYGTSSVFGSFNLPNIKNEPCNTFAPGSKERLELQKAIKLTKSEVVEVPCIINGEEIFTGNIAEQRNPADHEHVLCRYHQADKALLDKSVQGALAAKAAWEAMPFVDRAAIFLKAADLLSTKYRFKTQATVMLGQGKTAWQSEIDTPCELIDFWRFNAKYAQDIYATQPTENAPGIWNRVEYRPLEGFVLAISPFNFSAIAGNLCGAPALMGNVCLWKPAPASMLSNYVIYQILQEAGVPPGVIQFIPGVAEEVVPYLIQQPELSAIHFTGSTDVFKSIWRQVSDNMDMYKSFPRIVGETGGKNTHFMHKSADVDNFVNQTIRGAFEFQGQKCSACSRAYVPDSLWPKVKERLQREHEKIQVGTVEDWSNFVTAVINRPSFEKIKGFIDRAKDSKDAKIIAGGGYDDSQGYFIQPTMIETEDPQYETMTDEIFGPVVTFYVYPEAEFEEHLTLADQTSKYGLTCAIFAQDRDAICEATAKLRNTAGNFYVNDKCTGAVVGQQPFGGARASGTNDKAGASMNLLRWVSARSIKENFVPLESWTYPANQN